MLKIINMYSGLPKNIFIMFFVKFINAFGDFIVPFLSLYLTTKLGYSTAFAGSIVTVTVLLTIPGSMIGGSLADRWSKKGAYLVAQSSSAFFILLCGFLTDKHLLVGLLLLSAFFSSAIRPILIAFVYDLVEEPDRKAAYSLLYLGINIGVAVGPILAGFLFRHYLTLFFLGDAFTSYIAVFLVAFFVKDPKKAPKKQAGEIQSGFLDFCKILAKKPEMSLFFVIVLVLNFMYAQHSFSLPILLKNLYDDKSSVYFGYLMSVNALTVVIATTFITFATRKKTLLFNIACSGICMSLGFGMLSFPVSFVLFIPSTILWTFGEILLSTNVGIYVVQHVDETMRTRSSAFQAITAAAGRGIGIFSMGAVIANYGIDKVWLIIFIMGFAAYSSIRLLERRTTYTAKHSEIPCQ